MANQYRARIVSSEASAAGNVHLDCYLQRSQDSGETWELVDGGHRTVVLDGDAVLAITEDDSLSNAQKVGHLANLFGQEVKSWGIDKSDDANQQLEALVTFPANVGL